MTLKLFPVALPCMLPFVVLASAVLGNAAAPTPASACSCMAQTVEEARRTATLIVEGRVTRIDSPTAGDAEAQSTVTIQVVRSFQGTIGESLQLRTSGSSASCGYGFEQGKSYLIYADGEGDARSVSLCSRTQAIERAGGDIAVLGMGVTPFDPGPGSDQKAPPSAPGGASPTGHNTRGGCASCAIGAPRTHDADPIALRSFAALAGLCVLLYSRARTRALNSAARTRALNSNHLPAKI